MTFDPRHQSRALVDGADRAAARSYFKAIGFTDEDLKRPLVGVAHCWIEITPCNWNHRKLAEKVKEGIRAAGGTPDRVQHDQHHRRHLHGHRGHEGLAHQPRGDRRLRRAGRPRPPAGRLRRHLGLRQDHPGDGDGDGAPQPAERHALRRLDRLRRVQGAAAHDPGGLRGDRRLQRGQDRREGAERDRRPRLPGRRRLRRPVHGQHDVDRVRDARRVAHGVQRRHGHRPAQGRSRLRDRQARRWTSCAKGSCRVRSSRASRCTTRSPA